MPQLVKYLTIVKDLTKINMKIFIDFDDVIFNTKLLKKSLVKIFSENGVPKKDFEESYRLIFKNKKNDLYPSEAYRLFCQK